MAHQRQKWTSSMHLITNCLCWKVSTKFQVGDNKFQYRKFLEISSCLYQVFLEKCSLNLIPSLQATTTDINTFIDKSQVLINSHLRRRKRDRLHLPWLIGQKPRERVSLLCYPKEPRQEQLLLLVFFRQHLANVNMARSDCALNWWQYPSNHNLRGSGNPFA
jgi:hypothetical protein